MKWLSYHPNFIRTAVAISSGLPRASPMELKGSTLKRWNIRFHIFRLRTNFQVQWTLILSKVWKSESVGDSSHVEVFLQLAFPGLHKKILAQNWELGTSYYKWKEFTPLNYCLTLLYNNIDYRQSQRERIKKRSSLRGVEGMKMENISRWNYSKSLRSSSSEALEINDRRYTNCRYAPNSLLKIHQQTNITSIARGVEERGMEDWWFSI